jgi:hypothetical protein
VGVEAVTEEEILSTFSVNYEKYNTRLLCLSADLCWNLVLDAFAFILYCTDFGLKVRRLEPSLRTSILKNLNFVCSIY